MRATSAALPIAEVLVYWVLSQSRTAVMEVSV